MAVGLEIKLLGIERLVAAVGKPLGPVVRSALLAVGERVREEVAVLPGPVKKPINWASEKQRRYVMAQVREYGPWAREAGRSERLVASWKVEAERDDEVVVRNPVSYGPWVQGWFDQQLMHKQTGWISDQGAVDKVMASGDVDRITAEAIETSLWGNL